MIFYYGLFCLMYFCSCHGNTGSAKGNTKIQETAVPKEEVKYVNSIRLVSPQKNQLFRYNEDLNIIFENKDRFPIDSAAIFINGQHIATTRQGVTHFTYRLPEGKTGTLPIKVITWHPEHRQGIASLNIRVQPDRPPVTYQYNIVKVYPHDPKAYTQGLLYAGGYMYEGTGQYGESSIRKTRMQDGQILSVLSIDSQLFGEGIAIYQDKIYQLTWRSRKGFIYDLKTFSLESTFHYNSEGWGLTTAGDRLIMSDGSNKLYHVDPADFRILKEVEVYDHQGEVSQLNELEYVEGLVWANVWLTDRIVAIDPETGAVKGELHMEQLLSPADKASLNDKDDVLNGIAWNPQKGTFYVTGKRWPKLFEITITPAVSSNK